MKTKTTPSISFQILSDLHLEVGQQYSSIQFPIKAPYLILAGDVGRLVDYVAYRTFLLVQTQRFEKVFLVLGNHEFYGLSHSRGLELAHDMEIEPDLDGKLVLLHRKRFDIPKSYITLVGCSLWSHIPDEAKPIVIEKVNDFRKIDEWSMYEHNYQHDQDKDWLKEQIKNIDDENKIALTHSGLRGQTKTQKWRVIVVTHHAPCVKGTSEPKFDGSPWESAFATDLLTKSEDWPNVKTWVYGHTHYSTEMKKVGIMVVSNQRGYVLPGPERQKPEGYGRGNWRKFDSGFVVRV